MSDTPRISDVHDECATAIDRLQRELTEARAQLAEIPRLRELAANGIAQKHGQDDGKTIIDFMRLWLQQANTRAETAEAQLAGTEAWARDEQVKREQAEEDRTEARAEIVRLKRGEFICSKCHLRKDGETGPAEF